MPRPRIEPGPLDSKFYTLPRRYKSRLVPQGSTSVLYTYTGDTYTGLKFFVLPRSCFFRGKAQFILWQLMLYLKFYLELTSQLAFYVNLHRTVIGPSATLTGRWRPDIDLRRMLTGLVCCFFIPITCNHLMCRQIKKCIASGHIK